MSRFDTEDLMAAVKKVLVQNLNTKIAAVEAEQISKGLPATGLKPIDTTIGYYEQSWSDSILNATPAIFFGIEEIEAVGAGPATQETYKIFVEAIVLDTGQDTLTKNRIHRYSRAIKEVFEDNFASIPSSSKIKIETVRPVSFKLDLNSSEEIKVGGVSLTTSLA